MARAAHKPRCATIDRQWSACEKRNKACEQPHKHKRKKKNKAGKVKRKYEKRKNDLNSIKITLAKRVEVTSKGSKQHAPPK